MTEVMIFLSSAKFLILCFWVNIKAGCPCIALHLVWSAGSYTDLVIFILSRNNTGTYLLISQDTVTLIASHPVNTDLGANTRGQTLINI